MMVLVVVLVVVALVGSVVAWVFRHPTMRSIRKGSIPLPSYEIRALEALLADAGLPLGRVRVVRVRKDIPCWSYEYRTRLEGRLGVYRRFGRYGHNCIGIDGNRVTSLSLVETELSDLSPLVHLQALRHLQIRDARLSEISGLPNPCPWELVIFSQNELSDLSLLQRATSLEELDVSFNCIERVTDLSACSELAELNMSNNELTSVEGVGHYESLESLDLSANKIESLDGLPDMPSLKSLHIGSNEISDLAGLPTERLEMIYAAGNRIGEIDSDLFARCPSLRSVRLENNLLSRLPEGFELTHAPSREPVARPVGRSWPELFLARNPVSSHASASV
jgi:Leucine-rich repeat (LRR) protein